MPLANKWQEHLSAFVRFILKYPKSTLLVIAMLTAMSLIPISSLKPDNSLDVWFQPDDAALRNYLDRKENFGSDLSVHLIYRRTDLFHEEQLALIRRLSSDLASLTEVKTVNSILTAKVAWRTAVGLIQLPLLRENAPVPAKAKAKQYLISDPFYADNLVSRDGRAASLEVILHDLRVEERLQVVGRISALLDREEYRDKGFFLIGGMPLLAEMDRKSQQESQLFSVIALLVIYFVLIGVIRSAASALLPLLVAAVSTIYTLALFAIAGNSINMVTGIIPLITIVLSIADSIHIINRYDRARTEGSECKPAITIALTDIFIPCLFTTLTTAAAFCAFATSAIPPLRALGIYAALGTLLAFVISVVMLPALLVIISGERHAASNVGWLWIESVARRFQESVVYRGPQVVFLSLAIILFSVIGIVRIDFRTDQIEYLKSSNRIRAGTENLKQWFEGVYPFDLVLFSSEEDYFFKLESLAWLDHIGAVLRADGDVETVISPATVYSSYNRATSWPDDPQPWDSGAPVIIIKTAFSKIGANYGRYVSENGKKARISIRARWLNNKEMENLIERLSDDLKNDFRERGLSSFFTGFSVMYVHLNRQIIRSQITSIAFGFTTILLMLLVLFRDLRLALLGMVPNILPVVTTLGIIGWFGVKLDVATILIAAISLGIAVDDTIHFLWAYRIGLRKGLTGKALLDCTYQWVGRPVVLTTILLVCGFTPMLFSSFLPLVYFGTFVSLNIFFALIYDLTLLPVVLQFYEKNK